MIRELERGYLIARHPKYFQGVRRELKFISIAQILLLELFEYRHPEEFIFGEFSLGDKVSSHSAEEVHGVLVADVINVR